jgi:hypothetical protein
MTWAGNEPVSLALAVDAFLHSGVWSYTCGGVVGGHTFWCGARIRLVAMSPMATTWHLGLVVSKQTNGGGLTWVSKDEHDHSIVIHQMVATSPMATWHLYFI